MTTPAPVRLATVFGSSELVPATPEYDAARRLGGYLARAGYTVTNGGYHGLMAAVSQGAREAGGHVVGFTMASWAEYRTPNQWLVQTEAQPSLMARLERLLESDVLIALEGGPGTLAEVMLAWNLVHVRDISPRPVLLVGPMWPPLLEAFRRYLVMDPSYSQLLTLVESVEGVLPALAEWDPATATSAWKG